MCRCEKCLRCESISDRRSNLLDHNLLIGILLAPLSLAVKGVYYT